MIEFYEKQYQHELIVKDQLVQRMQLTLAVFIPVVGLLGFMLGNVDNTKGGFGFFSFVLINVVAIPFCLNFLWEYSQVWRGGEYHYIPTADILRAYHNDLRNLCDNQEADYFFESAILNYYVDAAVKNSAMNEERSYRLHMANKNLVNIAFIIMISGLVFVGADLSKPADIKVVSVPKSVE